MHKNEEGIVSFGKYTLLGGGDFMMGASCKAKDYGKKEQIQGMSHPKSMLSKAVLLESVIDFSGHHCWKELYAYRLDKHSEEP